MKITKKWYEKLFQTEIKSFNQHFDQIQLGDNCSGSFSVARIRRIFELATDKNLNKRKTSAIFAYLVKMLNGRCGALLWQ